jgi:hypothetical protein
MSKHKQRQPATDLVRGIVQCGEIGVSDGGVDGDSPLGVHLQKAHQQVERNVIDAWEQVTRVDGCIPGLCIR